MIAHLPMILASSNPMEHVVFHRIFDFGTHLGGLDIELLGGKVWLKEPFLFTDHMLMVLMVGVGMLVGFPLLARNYPLVPSGVRNLFETLMEFVRTEVARPSLHQHTDRFMPFLWTLFFFILFNNLFGLVPLTPVGFVVFDNSHLFGTATAGLSVTAGLALVAFVHIHVSGMVEQYWVQRERGRPIVVAAVRGFVMYWYKFVPHIPGMIGIILFIPLLVLELIGALVKPFALAIRLFANMMAGHVVLVSLLLMAPVAKSISDWGIAVPVVVGCVALNCLELFVAFLQAYIFTFLTCMFIGAAVNPSH